ncbi:hypothetical protein [Microcoleus sp. FACHB-672]|uniref:hypothetical protein n=1 Tax=Microcoleus sp. FACHB-672 TaxID=2692825 RepID=UPI001687166B|nr:hypothetical protein [Microcoleus sp. FACHB-672]MBD2039702.1 hypothetical protein [Microcoleus sp. FACHB-672]
MMQELLNKTLAELKALCREYSCFKGFSFYTKKADLIDFMANRITTLAEVTGVVMPVPVPVSQVTISGFVAEPAPKEPVPFEEEPEDQPDEWADPEDDLSETPIPENCPHCDGEDVKLIGFAGDVWRCSNCSAVGYTGDLVENLPRYCPNPFVLFGAAADQKIEEWNERRAQYAVVAKDGEDDHHRGSDPRRSEAEMPEPSDYQTFPPFEKDWNEWAASQEDEAEEEVSHLTALNIWWETYPDEVTPT